MGMMTTMMTRRNVEEGKEMLVACVGCLSSPVPVVEKGVVGRGVRRKSALLCSL